MAELYDTVIALEGDPTDPIVRSSCMGMQLDADRTRMDIMSRGIEHLKDEIGRLTRVSETLNTNVTWQAAEMQGLSERVQDPRLAHTSEWKSEPKFLTRQRVP